MDTKTLIDNPRERGRIVTVASVTEISATSAESFEEATLEGLARAGAVGHAGPALDRTLRAQRQLAAAGS